MAPHYPILVAALYRFVRLDELEALRDHLQAAMVREGVMGTILLAEEGINGTIAGHADAVARVLEIIRGDARLADLDHKESRADEIPFRRAKVRIKKEIVTLGVPDVDPTSRVGTYVQPGDWNALIQDPDVRLIDTRNAYEVHIGSFRGAEDPETSSFRDFPAYVQQRLDPRQDRRVAMFCTGGIRCEKATSYLLAQGFEEVYHLQGGILKYLEEVPPEDSRWEGECFVFDERVAVKHGLEPGSYSLCHACRMPLSEAECGSELFEQGVSCPYCHDRATEEDRKRYRERQLQMRLAEERGEIHLGAAVRRD